jgi:hypothetical protein
MSAGTDANVYLSLFGEKNKILRQALKKPGTGRNLFERDQKDDFIFEDNDIGKVRYLYFSINLYKKYFI